MRDVVKTFPGVRALDGVNLSVRPGTVHVICGENGAGKSTLMKVVLAKWLTGKVKIMILDEPTRGIDVGTKAEIHRLMGSFVREGMAIIMISSELPEIIGMSDRVVVMQEGRINGVLSREEATQESIMRLATQGAMKQAV
jgi:ABC-type sugar transport system ATPase subunit